MTSLDEMFISDLVRWCTRCEAPLRFTIHMNWFPVDGDIICGGRHTHETDYLYARVPVMRYNGDSVEEPAAVVQNSEEWSILVKEFNSRAGRRGRYISSGHFKVPIWPPPAWPGRTMP